MKPIDEVYTPGTFTQYVDAAGLRVLRRFKTPGHWNAQPMPDGSWGIAVRRMEGDQPVHDHLAVGMSEEDAKVAAMVCGPVLDWLIRWLEWVDEHNGTWHEDWPQLHEWLEDMTSPDADD